VKATSNWLESHARFRPQAEAVYDASTGARWTYRALWLDSVRWAGRLRDEGVLPDDRVAVLAHNRGETLAILFACAELGAVLVPLNWRLSKSELDWQLGHCGARVVIADAAFHGVLGGLCMDEGPGAEPYEGPGSALEAPWMLMYTSGSTGRPKGALLTHQQLHWNALNTILACDLTPTDATLTFTPLFHTGGMNSHTTPLLHRGGRVVLTRGFEAGEALGIAQAERISLLMGVPTIFQMLADHPDFDGTDLSSVRDAIVGGAALPIPLLHRWRARGIQLRQGFGMTEVGPNCFSMPAEAIDRKAGTVGLPIPHVAAKVVRPDGAECDADEAGELLLKGPVVCAGYWNDPESTAKSIRDGWFHTGDVLSRDEEGFFRVRGRIKDMFISGGENVYPPEVEAAIFACGGVAQVAVLGVPDERWGEVGLAIVQAEPDVSLSEAALRDALSERLARFKIPKHFRFLPELPKTASGKIDRPALRASLENP
jgi:fatty-acyl-CoA synthase